VTDSAKADNATPKRASIKATGALLGLKPSRIIHLNTIIVRHAVLIYSSTPLNAVHTWAHKEPVGICAHAPKECS